MTDSKSLIAFSIFVACFYLLGVIWFARPRAKPEQSTTATRIIIESTDGAVLFEMSPLNAWPGVYGPLVFDKPFQVRVEVRTVER